MESIMEGIIDENLCVNFRVVRALLINYPTIRVYCKPRYEVPESWKELMKSDYEFESKEFPNELIPELPKTEDEWIIAYNKKLQEAVQSINETINMIQKND
jgi:hypothetical protein